MLEVLVDLHGFLRWPVLLLGLLGVIWAVGMRGNRPDPARPDRILTGAFVGLLDLQLLLGIVLFALAGPDRVSHLGHAVVMLAAVTLAHVLSRRVRKAVSPVPGRQLALLFGLPLVAILFGVTVLLPSAPIQ